MNKLASLLFIYALSILPTAAQLLKGRILDAETNKPVAFASVGVLHRDAGTVADEQGTFQLNVSHQNPTDTLKISLVGYRSYAAPVAQFTQMLAQQNGIIVLKPNVRQLQEVVIKPRKTKTILAGNTTDSRFISAGFVSNDLGSEIGTVLRYNKKKPGKIEDVNFNIAYNSYDQLLFRVNIYDFKNGKIGENLLKEPLYLETSMEHGTLNLNLSDKNILITNDCLLSLEWIKDFGESGLMFSAGFFNSDSYARKISQGDWFKVPAGLGLWATIVHEK